MSTDIGKAIRDGDVAALDSILSVDPTLVHVREDGRRSLLHVATDWPGHFPNVRETICVLVAHGADVNARFSGVHSETPLHWAASSDDIDALDALLDHGAEIEAPGAVIDRGTPLADAVAFGQWRTAYRLVERGARSTIWQAAALGLLDRVEECLASDPAVGPDVLNNALWNACHGGQLLAAKRLLRHGADPNWVGHDGLTAFDAAMRNGNKKLVSWMLNQGNVAQGTE